MTSSYVDPTSVSVDHCETMATLFPDLAEGYYDKIAYCCQNKLWHQLTVLVLDFVENTDSTSSTFRILDHGEGGIASDKNTFLSLYDKVVMKVANKLNPLSLCRIGAAIATQCLEQGGSSIDESKQLLEDLLSKQQQASSSSSSSQQQSQLHSNNSDHAIAAVLYLQSKIALLTLPGGTTCTATPVPTKEEMDKIYVIMKGNAMVLNQLIPDTPDAMIVNAAHYEMSMIYYKIIGPPEAFYTEAIHYLNYYQPSTTSLSSQTKSHTLAVDLCLAALTGDGVYNLGQVVMNPIVQVLVGTPDEWLVDVLTTCSKGDVRAFHTMCTATYANQIASQPALVNMGHKMAEKITLLGLVELVFAKPASDRTLSYQEIATGLDAPVDRVEWVVMRAFSVRLMEGSMDQVDETVHVTWILPRSLGNDQMRDLATRFGDWATKVSKIKDHMIEETPAWTQ
jgi:26S proteasome regulatory subunit N9